MTLDVDPAADVGYFTFGAWLTRQAERRDAVGALARYRLSPVVPTGRDVVVSSPTLGGHVPGYDTARAEFDQWFGQNYPGSQAALAATERLVATEEVRPEPSELDPFDGEVGRLALLLAGALDDVSELLFELVRFVPVEGISERLRPKWRTLSTTVAALQKAVTR
jgi:hypothetical protein